MVFVSYAWIDGKPDERVLAFVNMLRQKGYTAELDVMYIEGRTTTHFTEMMITLLDSSEKTILVLSSDYKNKADSFSGGVGTEYRYIIDDFSRNQNKYILVSFQGVTSTIVPSFLQGWDIVDLSEDAKEGYSRLLSKLSGQPIHLFSPVNTTKTTPLQKEILDFSPTVSKATEISFERNLSSELGLNFSPTKEFTDLDKKRFLKSSYNEIVEGVSRLGNEYQQLHPNFTLDVEKIDLVTTYFTVYDRGAKKTSKSIFFGTFGGMSNEMIQIGECNQNSGINASISCDVIDNDLKLKSSFGFGYGYSGQGNISCVNDVIKSFWEDYLHIK